MSDPLNTPWRTDGYAVFDADGYEVCNPSQGPHLHETHTGNNGHWASTEGSHIERDEATEEALAAYIVTAANAYPALVEALQAIDAHWAEAFPEGPEGSRVALHGLGTISDETIAVWRKIRAALQSTQARKG